MFRRLYGIVVSCHQFKQCSKEGLELIQANSSKLKYKSNGIYRQLQH